MRESASLFNDRLKLDANANLMVQTIKNSPILPSVSISTVGGRLHGFLARTGPELEYATNFEKFDENRNMPVQSWLTTLRANGHKPILGKEPYLEQQ